jgi:hypothetical protein
LRATCLAWINVPAISSALRPGDVRERFLEGNVVGIDAIAEVEAKRGTRIESCKNAKHEIGYVIGHAPAVWKSSLVASGSA